MTNWLSPSRGWEHLADSYRQAAEAVESAALATADEVLAPKVQRAIMTNPDLNGEHDSSRDFTGIVPFVQGFRGSDNIYVGIPSTHPAAQEGHKLEYGDLDHPPHPILRQTVHNSRAEASRYFYKKLMAEVF